MRIYRKLMVIIGVIYICRVGVKEGDLNSLRESLSDLKKTKDLLRASNLKLKQ